MKILLACPVYDYLSGVPLHVHDLAEELDSRGHQVIIMSNTKEGVLAENTRNTIKLMTPSEPLRGARIDLWHGHGKGVTESLSDALRGVPGLQTCHSEWSQEDPVTHPSVRAYIAIRRSIWNKLYSVNGVDPKRIALIPNGIDFTRYNRDGAKNEGYALWVGTIDSLREKSAKDFCAMAEKDGLTVVLVGKKFSGWVDDLPMAAWQDETYDHMPDLVRGAAYTGGILLGRTTIESWACGKASWIYQIDTSGNIQGKALFEPPDPEEMTAYDIKTMTNKLEEIYRAIIS